MLKLAVVDDEWLSVECIVDMLREYKPQTFEIMPFTAVIDALRQFEINPPEILIVDIRMPRMNGLELIEHVTKHVNPRVIPVIVSGYSEFSYFKKALRNETLDYILKPVKSEELYDAMNRAICKYTRQLGEARKKAFYYEMQRQIVLETLVGDGIETPDAMPNAREYWLRLRQSMQKREFRVISVKLKNRQEHTPASIQELFLPVLGCADNKMEVFLHRHAHIDIILNCDPNTIGKKIEAIRKLLEPGAGVKIGISAAGNHFSQLPELHRQALAACDYRCYTGSRVNEYTAAGKCPNPYSESQEYNAFLSKLEEDCLLNDPGLPAKISFQSQPARYASVRDYNEGIGRMALTITLIAKNNNLPLDLPDAESLMDASFEAGDIARSLTTLAGTLCEALIKDRIKGCKSSMLQTLEYIDTNFSKDISLEYLSGMASIGRSYYCLLFKQLTGKTPTEYITELRIALACRLLLKGELRINEIAVKCGYPDQYYFCKVFKKQRGISPHEYRKANARADSGTSSSNAI